MNKLLIRLLGLSLFVLVLAQCQRYDKKDDYNKLLNLQKQQKKAHLNYNAEMFIDMFDDNIIQIRNGRISSRTKEESLKRVNRYFNSVKFETWDDIEPPIIKISEDGKMAYVIVHKEIILSYMSKDGKENVERNELAWLEVWEKKNDEWKYVAAASTNK